MALAEEFPTHRVGEAMNSKGHPLGENLSQSAATLMKAPVEETLRNLVKDLCIQPEDDGDESFFAADMGEVYRQYLRWTTCLQGVQPFYAVKCNPDKEVLRLLSLLGTGFDCSSRREMEMVLEIGVEPERIIYAQPCKLQSHLRFARRMGVSKMTFDGADELRKIKQFYPEAELLLRIVTDDSSSVCRFNAKFGAPPNSIRSLLETASGLDLNIVGVSFHIGSAAVDPLLFVKAVRDSRAVFDQAQEYGFTLKILDVGGGFSHESFEIMSQVLKRALDTYFPSNVQLIAEPGRFFVASAFTVACSVIARRAVEKEDGELCYMLYLNDGVYGSFMDCLLSHWSAEPRILMCVGEQTCNQPIQYTIWGPTCDGIDQILETAFLDKLLDVGDWLYFPSMGAYSTCLSTRFNGFSSERIVHYTSSESAASKLLGYPFNKAPRTA